MKIRLHLPKRVRKIYLVPEKEEVSFAENGQEVEFTLPKVDGYCVLELDYDSEE